MRSCVRVLLQNKNILVVSRAAGNGWDENIFTLGLYLPIIVIKQDRPVSK